MTEELDRQDCLKLLREHGFVARVGFVADGRPQIIPVNYVADPDEDVVRFCTAAGSMLGRLANGTQVALEVDESRPLYNAGWSVVVHGAICHVDDPAEVSRLSRGPLRSWAEPMSPVWIEIPVQDVTGRRIPET
ncbi:MAG TPA: pyridoxamine 5'-phosphate oxidase family protein [Actinomycetota bacterium]|nr:pyridoxamine 5'-phosphate oxidase family protein [Actinomycetota bacterium]